MAPPSPTFSAPGRYPDYFLAHEDFLSTKSSQTMDYDMESKVLLGLRASTPSCCCSRGSK